MSAARPARIAGMAAALTVLGGALVLAWHERALFSASGLHGLLADRRSAPLLFLALHLVASLSFVPRTLLGVAAGLAFGLVWGTFWALLGGMIGAWAGFAIARVLKGGVVAMPFERRWRPWLDRVERGGWRAVWVIRLLPLPHTPVNFALGATRLGWWPYSIGSFLGIIPSTVMAVGLGAAGEEAIGGGGWLIPGLVGLAGLALSMLLPRLLPARLERIAIRLNQPDA